jgi:hypothetical protein
MVRRLKSEIKNWDGSYRFPRRTLEHIPVDYTTEEQPIHALLTQYAGFAQMDTATTPSASPPNSCSSCSRSASSPPHWRSLTPSTVTALLRKSARYEALTRSTGALARIFEQADEDYADDAEQQEAKLEALEAAARAFRPPSTSDTQILNDLAGWGSALPPNSTVRQTTS